MKAIKDSGVEISGKLRTLKSLLAIWHKAKKKVLLFSYSTQTLDILQKFLAKLNYSFLRLDGKTQMNERGKIIEEFHNDKNKFIFLISTKAGGLGLNLTGINSFFIHFFSCPWCSIFLFSLKFLLPRLIIGSCECSCCF